MYQHISGADYLNEWKSKPKEAAFLFQFVYSPTLETLKKYNQEEYVYELYVDCSTATDTKIRDNLNRVGDRILASLAYIYLNCPSEEWRKKYENVFIRWYSMWFDMMCDKVSRYTNYKDFESDSKKED